MLEGVFDPLEFKNPEVGLTGDGFDLTYQHRTLGITAQLRVEPLEPQPHQIRLVQSILDLRARLEAMVRQAEAARSRGGSEGERD